jgi:hypothetical protein
MQDRLGSLEAMLVTGRGWVIATVAALLGGVGAFSGAMLNVLVGSTWRLLRRRT